MQQKLITRKVIQLNCIIALLVLLKPFVPVLAYVAGVAIVLYLMHIAISNPQKCFFLLIGIKFTFDALWDLRLSDYGIPFNLLELYIVPVLLLLLSSFRLRYREGQVAIFSILIYLLLIILSSYLNGHDLNYKFFVKQSGILIGFMLGLRFVNGEEGISFLMKLLLLSTVFPILGSNFQFFFDSYLSLPFFHYTVESVRGARNAGFYFDAATNGMVSIIALICSLQVYKSARVAPRIKILLQIFIVMVLVSVMSGSTRSIMFISATVLTFYLVTDLKKSFALFLLITPTVYFLFPYVEKIILKINGEVKRDVIFSELLRQQEYRGLLSGRVSLWQDIWEIFNSSSYLQQLFGTGIISNAHSSYFFLLLQIGWVGLFNYLLLHFILAHGVVQSKTSRQYKMLCMLCLSSLLLMGLSAAVVTYTSFQWIVYFILASAMNIYTFKAYGSVSTGVVHHSC